MRHICEKLKVGFTMRSVFAVRCSLVEDCRFLRVGFTLIRCSPFAVRSGLRGGSEMESGRSLFAVRRVARYLHSPFAR